MNNDNNISKLTMCTMFVLRSRKYRTSHSSFLYNITNFTSPYPPSLLGRVQDLNSLPQKRQDELVDSRSGTARSLGSLGMVDNTPGADPRAPFRNVAPGTMPGVVNISTSSSAQTTRANNALVWHQQSEDTLTKSLARDSGRTLTAVDYFPGAVPVGSSAHFRATIPSVVPAAVNSNERQEQPSTMSASMSEREQDALTKTRLAHCWKGFPAANRGSIVSQAEQVDTTTAHSLSTINEGLPTVVPGVQHVLGREANFLEKRTAREDGRGNRRAVRVMATPTAEKAAALNSTKPHAAIVTNSADQTPTQEALKVQSIEITSHSSIPLIAMLAEERQRVLLSFLHRTFTGSSLTTWKDELFMEEMEQISQPAVPPRHQISLQSHGTSTIADRGVAVVPNVEFGEFRRPFINEGELAVAIAIGESEENNHLPSAVEFDPDSKPALYKRRRFRMYGLVASCLLLVAIVVVAIVCSVVLGKPTSRGVFLTQSPTMAPTMAPTSQKQQDFMSYFARQLGNVVYYQSSPHHMAANWIIFEDPLQLELNAPNLLQRFLLALLYFQTTDMEKQLWVNNCTRPANASVTNCTYLQFTQLNNGSIAYVPIPGSTPWLSNTSECHWVGVDCLSGPNVLGIGTSKCLCSLVV